MMHRALYRLGVLGALLAGCGGGDTGDDVVTERGAPPGGLWYEADFGDPNAAARQHHTVILDLEPAAFIGEWLENVVRYELEAGTYRFCIDADEEFITGFTLENEAGEPVLSLERFMDCAEVELAAGVYTKRIIHDGNEILSRAGQAGEAPQSRVGFLQATNTPRVTDSNGRPLGGWWLIAPIFDDNETITAFPLDFCGPDDISVPCPAELGWAPVKDISEAQFFRFDHRLQNARIPVSMQTGFVNKTSPSPLFVFFNFASSSLAAHVQDRNTAGCPIDVYGVAGSPGYLLATQDASTLNSDCNTGYGKLLVNDLGGYTFQLQVLEPFDSPPTKASVYFFDFGSHGSLEVISGLSLEPATMKVLARLFRPEDGDDTAAIAENLPVGEVALFENCNYAGKMWVFGQNTADFSRLSGPGLKLDNAISSVRVGQNTTAILYSESNYQGKKQEIIADTPCLQGTTIGDNTASALQLGKALDILISSNECVGCKLYDLDLRGLDLDDVDFSKADLSFAQLNENHLRNARFIDATLERTNFNFARLDGAVFTGADLSGATLVGASLPGAKLDHATLTGTNFTQAHLYGNADFTGATMNKAIFNETILFRARLEGDLHGALFNRAVLVDALFDAAVLDEAVFNGAWLQGASFRGVRSARGANWANACMSADSGSWHFLRPDGVSEPVGYGVTELGALGGEASLICPSGDSGPCCPTGDLGACVGSGKLKPRGNPQPPDCLPDPDSWDGCRTPDPDEHYSLPTCTN